MPDSHLNVARPLDATCYPKRVTSNHQPIPTGVPNPLALRVREIQAKHAVDDHAAVILAYAGRGRLSKYEGPLKPWLLACRASYQDGSMSVGMAIALDTFMLGWRHLQPLDIDKAWHGRPRQIDPSWSRDYLAAMQDDATRTSDADLLAWIRPLRRRAELGCLPVQIADALDTLWSSWRVRQPAPQASVAA